MKCTAFWLGLVMSLSCGMLQGATEAPEHTFAIGERDFLLDGKPLQIRCGEIHFARVPPEYWSHRLKMAKAMGLNAVCVYLFWNFHEWQEGTYDWSGAADAAEFCRLAQHEGLWVILRPGPYSCAEWEMGGLPWWLLKREGIQLRTTDPSFLEPAKRYLKEVGRVLAPLQVSHGGPLLMVQVENEYGSYGNDAGYLGELRQALVDGGFDVPFFACNPAEVIQNGFRADLFQVVNFGRGAATKSFARLRELQKTGPLMNGEYYPGWFDTWGRPHHTGSTADYLADLEYMLKNGMSFSIYMAHGGTTFGLWAGADRPFRPDTSDYDYDAPINEAGGVTPKYLGTRELFQKYLAAGETLPAIPEANPVIEIPPFSIGESAPLFKNLPKPVADDQPHNIEYYDQSRGCSVYRTTLAAGPAGTLAAKEVHDYAWVFLDGKLIGTMDRRAKRYQVDLPARPAAAQLDILVEAVGRVNYGREVFDCKGLYAPVEFCPTGGESAVLSKWQFFALPLDDAQLASLKFKHSQAKGPAFWRQTFMVKNPADTYLDLRSWGKGVVWVNGHCLGRFWNIGPTQTMYCPGPWLHQGANEVVVLDLIGPREPKLDGLPHPILDELHPELDFSVRTRASGQLSVSDSRPAAEGSFSVSGVWQETKFSVPVRGRYVCFEAVNAFEKGDDVAVAELDVVPANGVPLSKSGWKVLWADSEDLANDADNILDGQSSSYWKTDYEAKKFGFPHRLVLDLGRSVELSSLRYLPSNGKEVAHVKDYRVYVSETPFGLKP